MMIGFFLVVSLALNVFFLVLLVREHKNREKLIKTGELNAIEMFNQVWSRKSESFEKFEARVQDWPEKQKRLLDYFYQMIRGKTLFK